jgi:hypothetical protein
MQVSIIEDMEQQFIILLSWSEKKTENDIVIEQKCQKKLTMGFSNVKADRDKTLVLVLVRESKNARVNNASQ